MILAEPSVAATPAIVKIKTREKRIKSIFLPTNFLYSAFISALFPVPDIVPPLEVIFFVNYLKQIILDAIYKLFDILLVSTKNL